MYGFINALELALERCVVRLQRYGNVGPLAAAGETGGPPHGTLYSTSQYQYSRTYCIVLTVQLYSTAVRCMYGST